MMLGFRIFCVLISFCWNLELNAGSSLLNVKSTGAGKSSWWHPQYLFALFHFLPFSSLFFAHLSSPCLPFGFVSFLPTALTVLGLDLRVYTLRYSTSPFL
jgi:hypothetical protein